MEGSSIELFNSQYSNSGHLFLSSVELKDIKQKLLSGDEVKLLQSLEKIETYLSNDESALNLLRSDISDFICDALIPSNSVVLSCAIKCLEYLIKLEEFFTQSHSSVVIESLTRCLYFLTKNSFSSSSLTQCLQLLIYIIHGYNNYQVNPEKKTVENIIQVMNELLKNNAVATYNNYQIGCLILELLNTNTSTVFEEILKTLFTIFSCWFDTVNDIMKSYHPLREDLTKLSCILCHCVIKCFLKNTTLEKLDSNIEKELKQNLFNNITNFIIFIGQPYFDEQFPNIAKNESSVLEYFLQTILYFFTDDLIPQKSYLAHGLGDAGFIQFASRVISHTDCNQSQKYHKLSALTLLHIILTLSQDIFKFPNAWPNGLDNFCNTIQEGFSQLPLDASLWLDILNCQNTSFSCKLGLLLYLYFYCLTAKSQNILKTIYPSIATFVDISNFTTDFTSALALKIVWFIYVVSQLSHAETIFPDKESHGFNKMVSVLLKQDDLTLIYTHHPAFLYWAFSFEHNYSLQRKIVYLWLRNKTSDCKVIEEIMKKSSDVKSVILDILQNDCGQVLESAFESIKSFLNEIDDEELTSNIWLLLPQTLAKYTADSASATNVDYIIELANMKTPKEVDLTSIMKLASLLPQVLVKSDLLSIVPLLTLTLKILEDGQALNDTRILHVFLRSDGYLKKIVKNFDAQTSEILVICLKIITFLWKNCNALDKPKKYKKIEIKKERILKIIQSNSIIVMQSSLNFLNEILASAFESITFSISGADSDFVEILFFEVQNISIRNIPETFSLCWSCLKSFLLLGTINKELKNLELMTNPILNEVINFHLPRLQHSVEMKSFLEVWLNQNNIKLNDSCFDKKIFGGYFQSTLANAVKWLEENFKEEDAELYEKMVQMII